MILYFSGTGNSKYVALRLTEGLDSSHLCMNDRIKAGDTSPVDTGADLVIVTPTYAWRIPRIVESWLGQTQLRGAKRAWFVMTCGSEIGNADAYNRRLCRAKGLTYMGTAQIVMPENYIAMFNAPETEEARTIVAKAQPDIHLFYGTMKTITEMPSLRCWPLSGRRMPWRRWCSAAAMCARCTYTLSGRPWNREKQSWRSTSAPCCSQTRCRGTNGAWTAAGSRR